MGTQLRSCEVVDGHPRMRKLMDATFGASEGGVWLFFLLCSHVKQNTRVAVG